MSDNHTTIDQFREAVAAVDPASLTRADCCDLIDVLQAAAHAVGVR